MKAPRTKPTPLFSYFGQSLPTNCHGIEVGIALPEQFNQKGFAQNTSIAPTVTPVSTLSENINYEQPPHGEPMFWKPSIFKARPLIGLAGLGVAIVCLAASLAVLIFSNGSPTSTWRIQPTVYLAVATAISNAAIQLSLKEAAPISWWYKALKGSTLRNLENEWQAGQSWPRALYATITSKRGGRFFNLLTIANIATAIVMVDGPLLQRSWRVEIGNHSRNVTLSIPMSPELPTGFAGTFSSTDFNVPNEAIKVAAQTVEKHPMVAASRCPRGICTTTIREPGLQLAQCTKKSWNVTNEMMRSPAAQWGDNGHSLKKPYAIVFVGPGYDTAGREAVDIEVGLLNLRNCTGQFVITRCQYTAAIMEYEVILQNDTVSFAGPLALGRFIARANNTGIFANNTVIHNSFAALTFGIGPALGVNATLSSLSNGSLAVPLYESVVMPGIFSSEKLLNGKCSFTTKYANDYAISLVNEAMFRGGLAVASSPNITIRIDPGLSVNQIVTATQTVNENIFHVDLRWFVGAAAIQILTILLLLPTFWGWWAIGLELSLSPINLAKAFDAPILRSSTSGAHTGLLFRDVGDVKVKLGVVASDVADHSLSMDGGNKGSRIGLGEADRVTPPHKGRFFTG